ncbi:hypothetical protein QYM41_08190 [Kocuria sp. CPCC 205268]|uniref:hypothetical protein n=1 Tax=Kocuria oxytropis TaxID=3058913 RepID=UPI0034D4AF4D
MDEETVWALEALMFALPLLGYPALIVASLVVDIPILRREPVTGRRRTAATVLAILSLIAAAPLLLTAWFLGIFGLLLLSGLVIPAVLTLVRLRRLPPTPRST